MCWVEDISQRPVLQGWRLLRKLRVSWSLKQDKGLLCYPYDRGDENRVMLFFDFFPLLLVSSGGDFSSACLS